MGHRSRSRSQNSRERSRHRKSVRKESHSHRHKHSRSYKSRSRSRSRSRDNYRNKISKYSDTSPYKKHKHSDSDDNYSNKSDSSKNLTPNIIQQEFEVSNFSKAYGLDLSGFVGLSSEILNATSASEEKKLSRFERRKLREHELKHHQERFWRCKKCDFMNYLSNYECKRCKGLRASCSS